MSVLLDVSNALSDAVGSKDGVSSAELKSIQKKVNQIHKDLTQKREKGTIGFYDLPYDKNIVEIIKAIAHVVRRKYEYFVHIGIGGSCLGSQLLCTALTHTFHRLREKRHLVPRFFFLDNPDPQSVVDLLEIINLGSTAFFVASKSGNTDETLAIFMILYTRVLKRLGASVVGEHFVVATSPQEHGALHNIAEKEKLRIIPLPENVSGRFSVFTAAGLYPAAVAGANIEQLLKGAESMDKRTSTPELERNPAYLNAVVHFLLDTRHDKNISVIMPYCDQLWYLSRWYQQLWAESLGKKKDSTSVGQTPIASLGTVDQHSLLQLILDGRNDKVVTLVGLNKFNKDIKIPNAFRGEKRIDYLRGKTLSQLMNSELLATEFVLTRHQRPNVRIMLEKLDEFHLGELLYMFEVQTAFAGGLYEVNPFDQPAVEEGKLVARTILGKQGLLDPQTQKELEKYIKTHK